MSTMPECAPALAVLLPGTGSDEVLVKSAFAGPLAELGIPLHTPAPRTGSDLRQAFHDELNVAAAAGPLLTGGISFGAHLAAEWAVTNLDRCAGLLVALPGWIGRPNGAPAALAARIGAANIDRYGLEKALVAATAAVPPWLAVELRCAWRRQGSRLAAAMRTTAEHPAPTAAQLRWVTIPAGVVACTDDPVHPPETAAQWASALPIAALRSITLEAFGENRETLGKAAIAAWQQARTR